MVIAHNLSAINANRQLNNVDTNRAKTTKKLSSGYRINTASDDAAGLSISEKMRAQIRGLNRASTNIMDGVSLTQTADGALDEIHSILQRQRELLVQAANDTNTSNDREAIQKELEATSHELDRIFDDTEFNTQKLFKGYEKIVDGPTVDTKVTTSTEGPFEKKTEKTTTIWLPKPSTQPSDTSASNTQTKHSASVYYDKEENVISTDALKHDTIERVETTTLEEKDETIVKEVKVEYKSATDPEYSQLKKPAEMVGSNGYINVKTQKGDLELSCAMSRLGVQVTKLDGSGNPDGATKTDLDLYNSKYPMTTTNENDGKTVITKFDLGDGLSVAQKIELTGGNTYDISYSIENTGSNDYKVDLRLAFDVMNTYNYPSTLTKGEKTGQVEIENDDAKVAISSTGGAKQVLCNINDIYYSWNGTQIIDGASLSGHNGMGYWWNDISASKGNNVGVGAVSYKMDSIKKDPYEKKETITETTTIDKKTTQTKTTTKIEPKYLDIQAGALAWQNIPIRLYNLSSANLHADVPGNISAFDTDNSLTTIDGVFSEISGIRSYYGAITNRLEHAYNVDQNTSENTQASESKIRDTDMAKEMVEYSAKDIIAQAGQAMLTQANSSTQGVLTLLQ